MKQPEHHNPLDQLAGQLSCANNKTLRDILKTKSFHEKTGAQYRKLSRMELINGLVPKDNKVPLLVQQLLHTDNPVFNKIAESAIGAYKEKKLELLPLVKALSHLHAVKCKPQTLKELYKAVRQFTEKGYRLAGLIEGASSLLTTDVIESKCTSKMFEAFGLAYQWMDIQIKNFTTEKRFEILPEITKAINFNLLPDALFAYCSVLSKTEKFDMGRINEAFRRHTADVRAAGETKDDIKLLYNTAIRCGFNISQYEEFSKAYFSTLHLIYAEIIRDSPPEHQFGRPNESASQYKKRTKDCLKEFREGIRFISEKGIADPDFIIALGKRIIKYRSKPIEIRFLCAISSLATIYRYGHDIYEPPEVIIGNAHRIVFKEIIPEISAGRKKEFCRLVSEGSVKTAQQAMLLLTEMLIDQHNLSCRTNSRLSVKEKKFLQRNAEHSFKNGDSITSDTEGALIWISKMKREGRNAVVDFVISEISKLGTPGAQRIGNVICSLRLAERFENSPELSEKLLSLYFLLHKKYSNSQGVVNIKYKFDKAYNLCYLLGEDGTEREVELFLSEVRKNGSGQNFNKLYSSVLDVVIKSHVNLFSRTQSSDWGGQYEILDRIEAILSTDIDISGDYPEGSLDRALDVINLQIKLQKYHLGFLGLAADAEHKQDPGKKSMLERMAKNLAEYQIIHSEDIDGNPGGPGIAISHIETGRVFAPDLDRLGDKFHIYKENWPEYADIIDNLKHANFCLTRGWIAVAVPRDAKLKIQSDYINGSRHYTLIIFNDHHGSLGESAFLVDTKLFIEKLKPALHDAELLAGNMSETMDVNQTGLTADDLLEHEKNDPFSVINIGSGNNIAGGFVNGVSLDNAYRSGLINAHIGMQDNVGLYNAYGYPNFELDQASLRTMLGLGMDPDRYRLHIELRDVAERNLKYLDLFMVVLSQYKKGYVNERQDIGIDNSRPDMEESPAIVNFKEEEADSTLNMNESLLRMLNEAREYRATARRKDFTSDNYRVMTFCDTDNPASAPKGELFLDTESGVLYVRGKEFKLNLDASEIKERDKKIWFEQVVPYMSDYFKTLRFYQKASLERKDL